MKFFFLLILMFFLIGQSNLCAEIPGIVLGNGINIRSGNGTQFDIIFKGKIGDIYPVESIENNGWFKIRLPQKINGFIRKDFLIKTPSTVFPMTVEVNASRVNVRVGPDVGTRWLTKFYHGDRLRAYSEVGEWYNIQCSNTRYGYIISKFFDLLDNRKGLITADCVNIRKGPGLDKTVVAKLYVDCPVIYLDQNEEWYKIKIRGGPVGWIFKKFVKFDVEMPITGETKAEPVLNKIKKIDSNRIPLNNMIPDPGIDFEELQFNE